MRVVEIIASKGLRAEFGLVDGSLVEVALLEPGDPVVGPVVGSSS